jgi:hypothetical protein
MDRDTGVSGQGSRHGASALFIWTEKGNSQGASAGAVLYFGKVRHSATVAPGNQKYILTCASMGFEVAHPSS